MVTKISYRNTEDAWHGFKPFITGLIEKNGLNKVCDIGGGANPLLNEEYIIKNGVDYSILDISETELSKAPTGYRKILADIASSDFKVDEKYDLVFTKMLAEHIVDAEQFHRNILNCLSNDGLAVHFFPTLYSFPFIINYLAPEYLSNILLNLFAPRDRHQNEKFPAYYHWCRGPTRRQIKKFASLGYEVVEYRGFFGHSGYYNKVKILKAIHEFNTKYLLRHPNPYFTSYAYVVLKKQA